MRALRMAPVFPSATAESVSTLSFFNYKKAAAYCLVISKNSKVLYVFYIFIIILL